MSSKFLAANKRIKPTHSFSWLRKNEVLFSEFCRVFMHLSAAVATWKYAQTDRTCVTGIVVANIAEPAPEQST